MIIESRVKGIPCQIDVLSFNSVSPDPWADNPADYYGFTECEYNILDRRGRPAGWLERKMTDDDRDQVEMFINDYVARAADDDRDGE